MNIIKGITGKLYRVVELNNGKYQIQSASRFWLERLIFGWKFCSGDFVNMEETVEKAKKIADNDERLKRVL